MNVVVDGSPTDGTVLVLSHWPHMTCPEGLEADLSAEMAFASLDAPEHYGPAMLVTNNQFDQDGLVGIHALCAPEAALGRRELLVDLAAAGDFATYRFRAAARASMAIAAYADPARSPMGALASDRHERTAQLYEELLGRVVELVEHPERYRSLWQEEDAHLEATEEALARGAIGIEELRELDLVVVRVGDATPGRRGHRFAHLATDGPHPMAVHNVSPCFVVVLVRGRSYELTYRYESWVQYRSRGPRPRVDLSALADELSALEGEARWVFDGVAEPTPRLHLVNRAESRIEPGHFLELVRRHLASGPTAWDPYAPR